MSAGREVRGHESLPHTADVGLRAWGPTPAIAFEEAALALSELTADIGAGAAGMAGRSDGRGRRETIELAARDPVGLAYAWLNELVGLIDLHGALIDPRVVGVGRSDEGWRLHGSARFVGFDGIGVRRGADVKSATYHGLAVEETKGGWALTAYLDI